MILIWSCPNWLEYFNQILRTKSLGGECSTWTEKGIDNFAFGFKTWNSGLIVKPVDYRGLSVVGIAIVGLKRARYLSDGICIWGRTFCSQIRNGCIWPPIWVEFWDAASNIQKIKWSEIYEFKSSRRGISHFGICLDVKGGGGVQMWNRYAWCGVQRGNRGCQKTRRTEVIFWLPKLGRKLHYPIDKPLCKIDRRVQQQQKVGTELSVIYRWRGIELRQYENWENFDGTNRVYVNFGQLWRWGGKM